MNRRSFLIGLGATIAVTALPATVLETAIDNEWEFAVKAAINRYMTNWMIFGQGMLLYNETWPYIHNIDPADIIPFDSGPGVNQWNVKI